MNTYPVLN